MNYLPESTRLLYAQLLSQCLNSNAPSGRGLSFVTKTIKGSKQWYLQLTVGSRKTQHYLGPDSDEVRSLVESEKALWETAAPDVAAREQLVSMLTKGGAYAANPVGGVPSVVAAPGRAHRVHTLDSSVCPNQCPSV
jgi:hypothetical protein